MEEICQKVLEFLSKLDWLGMITAAGTAIAAIAAAVSASSAKKASDISLESNKIQKEQVLLQNRLALLDKRIENYLLCRAFFNLTHNEKELEFNFEQAYPLNINIAFEHITNTEYFGRLTRAIYNLDDEESAYNFAKKIENLDGIAEKSLLLFGKKHGQILKDFIVSYRGTLIYMYNYASVVFCMNNDEENAKIKSLLSNPGFRIISGAKLKTTGELMEEYEELKIRKKIQFFVESLKESINNIENNDTFNVIQTKLTVEGERLK